MSERFRRHRPSDDDPPPAVLVPRLPPLPAHLARRLLHEGEQVTWVRGPRWSPSWEPLATHINVFLAGLALGGVCIAAGVILAEEWYGSAPAFFMAALVSVVGSIIVLAAFNGHFTRLVVTNRRIVIMQGYEIRRAWGLDDLPRSLLRYTRGDEGEPEVKGVDVGALQKMLGGSGDGFVEAKAVWALGKQLDKFEKRDE